MRPFLPPPIIRLMTGFGRERHVRRLRRVQPEITEEDQHRGTRPAERPHTVDRARRRPVGARCPGRVVWSVPQENPVQSSLRHADPCGQPSHYFSPQWQRNTYKNKLAPRRHFGSRNGNTGTKYPCRERHQRAFASEPSRSRPVTDTLRNRRVRGLLPEQGKKKPGQPHGCQAFNNVRNGVG